MSKLRILELFGGIGACSKALERLGIDYEIADYVEIDKYAVKSFNAIHNTNFEPQDICEWNKDIDVDLIMHGSPCQDFSVIGKQQGGDKNSGTRSSLMYETIRIVEKLNPKYVIWENVKNLLSDKHKHNFNAYLEIMEHLGYTNFYQVLNAKDYGIPQNRERIFTISIKSSIVNFKFPEKQKLKEDIYSRLEKNISKEMLEFVIPKKEQLDALYNKKSVFKNRFMLKNMGDIAYAITTKGRYHAWTNNFVPLEDMILKKENNNANYIIGNNIKFRGLTPLEYWRLMGFEDKDYEKAAKVNSNTQLYKQAGNSIVVNVLMAILNNLLPTCKNQNNML